ncbi:MAG TPA: hypothetical protein VIH76_01180 [Candidatus Acidoferrales bacterium]
MEPSTKEMLIEFFEENKKWWEDAADFCERHAKTLQPPEKERELLLSAVYRERAEKQAQEIERLRAKD